MPTEKKLKTCEKGHRFYKSSDCPTCPVCAAEEKPEEGFLTTLAAPARRALENNGITTLKQLSKHSLKEIMAFHGMGKASVPKLITALKKEGLGFKE